MKYFLIIIFVWTSLGVHAQHEKKHVDHLVSKFIKSLEARNITNYMYMYEYFAHICMYIYIYPILC